MKPFYINNIYVLLFSLLIISNHYTYAASKLPVGSEIVNQATIKFQDESGNTHVTSTNIVVLTIRQVFSAILDGDRTLSGLPGKTVVFFHTLENTGNGSDTYCLSIDNDTNDNGDFSVIRLYHDTNVNGRVDNFDPMIASLSDENHFTITLKSGQIAHLIVSADIPQTAAEGQFFQLIFSAKARQGTQSCINNTVTDIGVNLDSSNDTNHDRVTITNQAILVVNKEGIYQHNSNGLEDDSILYKVTIQNKGNLPARDIIITDILPDFTSYRANSIQSSSDFVATPDTDDGANGSDGSIPVHNGDSPGQLVGEIDYLSVDAEVIFTYVLDINDTASGGTNIENTVMVQGDLDENEATNESAIVSNKVFQIIPKYFNVTITDTGTGASPSVNDGGDDDISSNDQQYVDQAQPGETVFFTHRITNLGNTADTYNLFISNSTFPSGTSFQFFMPDHTNFLLDTTSDGFPDTGLIDPDETITIVIGAVLPTIITTTPPFVATIVAKSFYDNTIQDSSTDHLGAIYFNQVDLANSSTATGFHNDIDADPVSQITTTKTVSGNLPVVFDLYVANEGKTSDQYQLSAWMDEAATILPPETWRINFLNESGVIISSTPSIQPGNTFHFQAKIFLPDNMSPQLFLLYFKVYSSVSGVWDIKQDALEISIIEGIRMTPDNENTVSPGSSVEYVHNIQNIGNNPIAVKISVISQTLMSHSLMLPRLFTGSDVSSYQTIQNFSEGDTVIIFDQSENMWRDTAFVSDNSGSLAVPLDPDDVLRFKVRVMAPTSVSQTSIDILNVQASVVDGDSIAINTDRTIVANSQLQIVKTGVKDSSCGADLSTLSQFSGIQFQANPGECIVWQLVVINVGAEPVCQVTLYDKAPAFTFMQGVPIIYEQPPPGDTGFCSVSNEEMECFLGNPVDINADGVLDNYCLQAGERAEVRFRVEIE